MPTKSDKRSLIIQDDEDLLFIIDNALKEEGFTNYSTEDIDDALEKISKLKPMLIVVDLSVKDFDIDLLIEKINETEKYKDFIPLLLVAEGTSIKQAENIKPLEIVKKPFSAEKLKNKIELALKVARQLTGGSIKDKSSKLEVFISKEFGIISVKLRGYATKINLLDIHERLESYIQSDPEENKLVLDLSFIESIIFEEDIVSYLFKFYSRDKFYVKNIKIVTDDKKVKSVLREHIVGKNFEILSDYNQSVLKLRLGI